jgi:hypothetical protein
VARTFRVTGESQVGVGVSRRAHRVDSVHALLNEFG